MIGAIPPSACWRPGTMCAGTDNEGAMVVKPDVVACRVLPSGCIIGVRNGVILLFCDSRCACVEGYRMCVHPLSAIYELLLIILFQILRKQKVLIYIKKNKLYKELLKLQKKQKLNFQIYNLLK